MKEKRNKLSDSKSSLGGTYVLSKLEQQDVELVRLQKQAGAMPQQELGLMKQHGLQAGMAVLDAACGPGITAGMIYDFVRPRGGSVTGVDQDQELLRLGKALAREHDKEINFVHGDVYDLPFVERFDYIYCRFLFQHLEDPAKALASLARALKPNGIIQILDVNDEWLFLEPSVPAFEELCRLARHHQAQMGGNRLIGKSLRNLLQQTGLVEPATDVLMVNSDILGLQTFLELTTFFKKEIISQGGDNPEPLIQEIKESCAQGEVFGACGIFSVSARKPA
ncbi:MAG: methyltransferase domain-containing protein [Bacteroidota bacterium]